MRATPRDEIQISGGDVQACWNHQTINIVLEVRIKELHNISNVGMHNRYNMYVALILSFYFMHLDPHLRILKERNKVVHVSSYSISG